MAVFWYNELIMNRRGFTLLELLVVVGILAVLATVAVLVINPAEYIKQSRDSKRIADIDALDNAMALAEFNNLNMGGASTTVFVSLVDTVATCTNLGLPALPTGYQYRCVTTAANLNKVDGTGWIPVSLTSMAGGAPLSVLPVDPVNDATRFYTYIPGGSFALSATLESDKYIKQSGSKDGGPSSAKIETGSDLKLLTKAEGLVSNWSFDEGGGTVVNDSGIFGKNGSFLSAPIWRTEESCVFGKCLQFDNVDDGVNIANENFTSLTNYTMAAWVNMNGNHKDYTGTILSSGDWNTAHWALGISQTGTQLQTRKADGVGGVIAGNFTFSLNKWYHVAITRSGTSLIYYVNGNNIGSFTIGAGQIVSGVSNTTIGRETYAGGHFDFNGRIDNVRIYNRSLTAAEIKGMYDAGK